MALGAVAAGTFAMPAQGTLIPDLARDDAELGTANVVASALDNLACVVGPAIAGVLIVLGGVEIAFAINGLSFLVVVAVLVVLVRSANRRGAAIELVTDAAQPEDASTGDGWASIARDAIRPLTMDAAISFAAGAPSKAAASFSLMTDGPCGSPHRRSKH